VNDIIALEKSFINLGTREAKARKRLAKGEAQVVTERAALAAIAAERGKVAEEIRRFYAGEEKHFANGKKAGRPTHGNGA
jgi:hypothetical protein